MKPVYKILAERKDNPGLHSVCMNQCMPYKYRTYYPIGIPVYPNVPNTKLFCFDTFAALLRFAKELKFLPSYFDSYPDFNFRAFEGYALNPQLATKVSFIYSINDFWKYRNSNLLSFVSNDIYDPPLGTLECDAITIIQEMRLPRYIET